MPKIQVNPIAQSDKYSQPHTSAPVAGQINCVNDPGSATHGNSKGNYQLPV
jgi:hypothetical protein